MQNANTGIDADFANQKLVRKLKKERERKGEPWCQDLELGATREVSRDGKWVTGETVPANMPRSRLGAGPSVPARAEAGPQTQPSR